MKIIQIVRRYGPIGGMERYAWELSRELAALGHQVTVICERCHVEKPAGIRVVELGEVAMRPRWVAQVRFARRVRKWLRNNPAPGTLIHSHERVDVHHVTTFHGPPFATILDAPFWKRISLRVVMRLHLERRELHRAQVVVPNSAHIASQLAHYYPQFQGKLTAPVEPGVEVGVIRSDRHVPKDGGVVCFVGIEWERKGLPFAVEVVERLRKTRPKLELWVVGPPLQQIEHLFKDWGSGYRLLGFRSNNDYLADADVLLHPARAEPYGMVIAEAMAARVPVVISDVCGAAVNVTPAAGRVLSLHESQRKWAEAVEHELSRDDMPPTFERDWHQVAVEYEALYRNVWGKL